MTLPIYSYGLHKDADGVTWLHQANEAINFIGLNRPSPFKIQAGSSPCPHRFEWGQGEPNSVQLDHMRRMLRHPVLQQLAPGWGTPGFYYIGAEGSELDDWVATIQRYLEVSNPVVPLLHPLFNVSKRKLYDWYRTTTCVPLVISHVATGDTIQLAEITAQVMATTRPVIFIGDPKVVLGGNVKHLVAGRPRSLPYQDLSDWRALGSLLIKAKAQGVTL